MAKPISGRSHEGKSYKIVEKLQRTFRRRHVTDDQTGPMEESRVIRARGGHSREGDQAAGRRPAEAASRGFS